MLELLFLISTTLILKHARFSISNNCVTVKFIISFLITVFQYWELILHYFLDVSYIPSCMIGLRNFKMAKLEEPRHVGIPVAHMGMKKSEYFYEPLFYKCVSQLISSLLFLWWEMNYAFSWTVIPAVHFLNDWTDWRTW